MCSVCARVRALCLQPHHPVPAFQASPSPAPDLCPRDAPGLPGVSPVGGKKGGVELPCLPDARQRPKVSAAGAAPPPSRLLPSQPEPWEAGTPKGLGAPDIQPPTWKVSTENHPRRCRGGGGVGGAAFRAGGGRGPGGTRLAGWPPRELSGRGTEPGCPCDCGVLEEAVKESVQRRHARESRSRSEGRRGMNTAGLKATATRT